MSEMLKNSFLVLCLNLLIGITIVVRYLGKVDKFTLWSTMSTCGLKLCN